MTDPAHLPLSEENRKLVERAMGWRLRVEFNDMVPPFQNSGLNRLLNAAREEGSRRPSEQGLGGGEGLSAGTPERARASSPASVEPSAVSASRELIEDAATHLRWFSEHLANAGKPEDEWQEPMLLVYRLEALLSSEDAALDAGLTSCPRSESLHPNNNSSPGLVEEARALLARDNSQAGGVYLGPTSRDLIRRLADALSRQAPAAEKAWPSEDQIVECYCGGLGTRSEGVSHRDGCPESAPAAEPVAWRWESNFGGRDWRPFLSFDQPRPLKDRRNIQPLYAAAPAPVGGVGRDDLHDMLAAAFVAGCEAVQENYQPDPEFGEAGSDYATSILTQQAGPRPASTVGSGVAAEKGES